MPCTNVALRLTVKGLTPSLWDAARILAQRNGVRLHAVLNPVTGTLSAVLASDLTAARDWVLAAAAVAAARKQGYRVTVKTEGDRILVTGAST